MYILLLTFSIDILIALNDHYNFTSNQFLAFLKIKFQNIRISSNLLLNFD